MTDVGRNHLELVERVSFARVVLVARLREVPRCEAVVVEHDQRARLQHGEADLERGGIERDEHVGRITRGRDGLAAEIDLVSGYAERRACRRPDLRRVVGKGCEVPARECSRDRELRAHELYSVARVAGQAHDNRL